MPWKIRGVWKTARDDATRGHPGFDPAILLDPCLNHELEEHFDAAEDGRLIPRGSRASVTIDQFRLNRAPLVKERSKAISWQSRILSDLCDSFIANSAARPTTVLEVYPSLPDSVAFPGFCALLILARMRGKAVKTPAKTIEFPEGIKRRVEPFETLSDWKLTEVRIENFKSIESLTMTLPRQPNDEWHQEENFSPGETVREKAAKRSGRIPAILILGENSAGKSTILEAIALALLPPPGRAAVIPEVENLILDPRLLGGKGVPASSGSIRLTFNSESEGEATCRLHLAKGEPLGISHEGFKVQMPVFAYGAFRHFLAKESEALEASQDWDRNGNAGSVISLFRSEIHLHNPESWLSGLPSKDLGPVVAALRAVFGNEEAFSYILQSGDGKHCVVVSNKNGQDAFTPLSVVSSGFRAILSMMCDVMRRLMEADGFVSLQRARAIVLVDEIEAHLHPRWKLGIMDGLRKALPNVTFIVTSHDPLCLRGMNNGEVKVLVRAEVAGGDIPIRVEELKELPDMALLTVEQILTSDFFRLFDIDDPDTSDSMAALATALSKRNEDGMMRDEDKRLLQRFKLEIEDELKKLRFLPVGRSVIARLIQDAVANYVVTLRKSPLEGRTDLRAATVDRIAAILDGQDAEG